MHHKICWFGSDNTLRALSQQPHLSEATFAYFACPRPSPIAVIAPQGGGSEPGTSELVEAIPGQEFSLYCFGSLKTTRSKAALHITSTRFDEPACLAILAHSDTVLALHGSAERGEVVHVGGRPAQPAEQFRAALAAAGFAAKMDDTHDHPRPLAPNMCNRGRSGRGCQSEVTRGMRLSPFDGLKRDQRKHPTERFH